ncbi:hypothetical protein ACN38_g472 [Penicillium nordicum]|uniref:Uncharacterized protein n=1 Tax=Penicillium nordicum TaxID=229535 RepID=A0A0M8PD71_9EURO|nr:hypothetical protein ACN38_g472 [Penicillium nordicum]
MRTRSRDHKAALTQSSLTRATPTELMTAHKPQAGELVVGWVITCESSLLYAFVFFTSTYDHRVWKIGLPVRSAVLKPHAGELVVGWVTTSESSLLYVFAF